jgi:hypothetical protein
MFLRLSRVATIETPRENELKLDIKFLKEERELAYSERDRCVAFLAKVALNAGWTVGTKKNSIQREVGDWPYYVYMDSPAGQLSWPFNDNQKHYFQGLPEYIKPWDGHDTLQKYNRMFLYPVKKVNEEVRVEDKKTSVGMRPRATPGYIRVVSSLGTDGSLKFED